jgi:hypothetical protein
MLAVVAGFPASDDAVRADVLNVGDQGADAARAVVHGIGAPYLIG